MFFTIVFLLLVLNIAVSRHVYMNGQRLRYEKIAEIGLIWILPFFGALVSLCITAQGPSRVREYEDVGKFFGASH
ncbi:MAG: hypothetical protein PsegKO_30540 [Pseudohongiellaceae bacterium]|jgi:hypothetical protein